MRNVKIFKEMIEEIVSRSLEELRFNDIGDDLSEIYDDATPAEIPELHAAIALVAAEFRGN